MCKNEQNIHYCTILSARQWDFLLDGRSSVLRQKCLHRLMTAAVRVKTVYRIKGIEIVLEVGQAAASDVEMAEYLKCNRKTVGKLIDSFNRLGVLTTRTNNRTSIHTLHFLTGWYVDGVLLTNPHYVRPAAVPKGQSDNVRTPYSNDTPLKDKPCTVPDDCQCARHDTNSITGGAAALSSSLCSPVASSSQDAEYRTGNQHITDDGKGLHGNNTTGSPKEAQDGTVGGADNTGIGTGK